MTAQIKRRSFGSTGLKVSEVSFGAMNLRLLDNLDQAYQLLNYVLDQGVNLIDTARAYNGTNGQGTLVESEVLVGNVIRQRRDLHEPIVVVTKGHGYTLSELEKELATSLGKLGVAEEQGLRIGPNPIRLVYFFHGINAERWQTMQNSGVLEKIQQIKQTGKVSYIGFSSHYGDGAQIKAAIDTGLFDVVELPYNVFNRRLGEDGELDLIKYAAERGLAVINMKAFNGNGMVPLYAMLREYLSIDYQSMLRFCLSNPNISTVDAGARTVSEFRQDIEAAAAGQLSPQELAALKEEADTISGHLNQLCRECMHCLEKFSCPQDVDFPRILALHARYQIAHKLGKNTEEIRELYKELSVNASSCVACDNCLPWCEYKLNIPAMLEQAHQVLS